MLDVSKSNLNDCSVRIAEPGNGIFLARNGTEFVDICYDSAYDEVGKEGPIYTGVPTITGNEGQIFQDIFTTLSNGTGKAAWSKLHINGRLQNKKSIKTGNTNNIDTQKKKEGKSGKNQGKKINSKNNNKKNNNSNNNKKADNNNKKNKKANQGSIRPNSGMMAMYQPQMYAYPQGFGGFHPQFPPTQVAYLMPSNFRGRSKSKGGNKQQDKR